MARCGATLAELNQWYHRPWVYEVDILDSILDASSNNNNNNGSSSTSNEHLRYRSGVAVAAADGRTRLGFHDNDAAVSKARRQVATVRGVVHRMDERGVEQLRKSKCKVPEGRRARNHAKVC